MFQKSLANPLVSPIPICSTKPRSQNSPRSAFIVRSNAVDSSKELFESPSISTGTGGRYPGGMGLHTGRDPSVKKPEWLRQRAPQGEKFAKLRESLSMLKLNTVCVEAQCPNIGEVKCFFFHRFLLSKCAFLSLCYVFVSFGTKS